MATETGTLYADLLLQFLDPVIVAAKSPTEAEDLLEDLGYVLPAEITAFQKLSAKINEVQSVTTDLKLAVENGNDAAEVLPLIKDLGPALKGVIEGIRNIKANLSQDLQGFQDFIDETDILDQLPDRLFEYLFFKFFEDHYQKTYSILLFLDVLQEEEVQNPPPPHFISYKQRRVAWNNFSNIFKNPIEQGKERFYDGANFTYELVLHLIEKVGLSFAIDPTLLESLPNLNRIEQLNGGIDLSGSNLVGNATLLRYPLIGDIHNGLYLEFYPLVDPGATKYTGLGMVVIFGGETEIEVNEDLTVKVEYSAESFAGLGINMVAGDPVAFINNIETDSPSDVAANTQLRFKVSYLYEKTDTEPVFRFGDPDGSVLEIGTIAGAIGMVKSTETDLFVEVSLEQGFLAIRPANPDSFIGLLLGGGDVESEFNVTFGISSLNGFYFKGSTAIEIIIPVHASLGIITVNYLAFKLILETEEPIKFAITSGFTGELGPFATAVEDIGLAINADFENNQGNFGGLNMANGFHPPKGLGLALDAGAVKGGGYLFLDFEKGEYAGVAELTIKETISVKAIGIINTKLPDGRPGFAMLLLITAEFAPIQLGFGFTLNGVGGLIAVNRGMYIDALAEGVRTNAIDAIMFPEDPVANAPQVIANLKSFFPLQEGRYTFGLMGIIGWGSPTLIQVELGLIIQVPDPIVFAILGVIKMELPDRKKAIAKIQVNFLGVIDFEGKYMFLFASLFDSRILTFTLEGDMYFSIDWGDRPNFIFTIGGFHPDFSPPPLRGGISQLKRVTLSLLGKDNPRLTLTCYFAVTANTAQFGASVDFYYKIWKVKVIGYLYFDALFQFNPFYFKVTIGAGLAVMMGRRELFGIHLSGSLEGPTPWRIKGRASFRVLFVKVKVRIDKTFGEKRNTSLPPIAIAPPFVRALADQRNWQAELPKDSSLLVSLRKLDVDNEEERLVAHPYGVIAVSQNKLPLGLRLDKYGNDQPSDFKAFKISIAGTQVESQVKIKDFFAPAQYLNLSAAEKLSKDSYVKMQSGIRAIGEDGFASHDYIEKTYEYEICIIDSKLEAAQELGRANQKGTEKSELFDTFAKGGAVAKSKMGRTAKARRFSEQKDTKVQLREETYVIVRTLDFRPLKRGDTEIAFSSQAEADVALKRLQIQLPQMRGKVKVLATYELS